MRNATSRDDARENHTCARRDNYQHKNIFRRWGESSASRRQNTPRGTMSPVRAGDDEARVTLRARASILKFIFVNETWSRIHPVLPNSSDLFDFAGGRPHVIAGRAGAELHGTARVRQFFRLTMHVRIYFHYFSPEAHLISIHYALLFNSPRPPPRDSARRPSQSICRAIPPGSHIIIIART